MYNPKYTITNKILTNIGVVEACREVVNNAPIIPSYEKKFRAEAETAVIHHGTHIEGNELSYTQAEEVLAGKEVTATDRDIQEVINYRSVLEFIDGEVQENISGYTEKQILKIHSLTMNKLLPEDQSGQFRNVQVILRNAQTGEVVFRPPQASEIPTLITDFLQWLNSAEGMETHPVIRSGIVHYVISSVHPFTDGDGRAARGFATMILFKEGYDIKKLFSLEEYFDKNAFDYYDALRKTDLTNEDNFYERDLTGWLEFFVKGLAIELTGVKEKIRKVSVDDKIKERLGGRQVALNERQMKIMEYIEARKQAKMSELKPLLPKISEDTILRELSPLIKQKLIRKKGSRKAARYILK